MPFIFKKKKYLIFFIFLSIISFFLGFLFRENSAGGGNLDFNNTWPNLKIFLQNDLISSIKNTKTLELGTFISSRIPTSYILNKFFNPFTYSVNAFLFSVFLLSFLAPFALYFALKKKFVSVDRLLLFSISFILLLSPYFRTSAFWAGEENYGLITIFPSFFFYYKYLKEKSDYVLKLNIILFSFFSCLSVYLDQKLLIIPIIFMYLFLKNEKKFINISIYLIVNFFFSVPILILIYFWGNITASYDAAHRHVGSSIFLENIGYASTIIFFYFIPYLIFNFKKIILDIIKDKKYFILYSFFFFIYLCIISYFPSNFYDWDIYGKGWLSKLVNIIFRDSNFKNIFIYVAFFLSGLFLLYISRNNSLIRIILLYFFILSVFILPLFQEYFDPLLYLLIVLFFYKKKDMSVEFIIFNYLFYTIFLVVCLFYYSQIRF
jgi:hypothetical protein